MDKKTILGIVVVAVLFLGFAYVLSLIHICIGGASRHLLGLGLLGGLAL